MTEVAPEDWSNWMSAAPSGQGSATAEGHCAALVGAFRISRNHETLTRIVCGENFLEVDRKAVRREELEAAVAAARTRFDEVVIETEEVFGPPRSIVVGLRRTPNLFELCRDGHLPRPYVVALLDAECRELQPKNRPAGTVAGRKIFMYGLVHGVPPPAWLATIPGVVAEEVRSPTADLDDLKRAMAASHPDHGGDAAKFTKLYAEYAAAKRTQRPGSGIDGDLADLIEIIRSAAKQRGAGDGHP